jgi:hypothetical protein
MSTYDHNETVVRSQPAAPRPAARVAGASLAAGSAAAVAGIGADTLTSWALLALMGLNHNETVIRSQG